MSLIAELKRRNVFRVGVAYDMTASMKNNPHAGQNRTPGQALFREPAVAEPIQFDALGAT